MRKIDKIIVHCTATKEGKEFDVEDIRRWHKARGWNDIGYHYLILLDGTIQKGRKDSVVGAHCKGHNSRSIGVCYVGGVDENNKPKDTRTHEQKLKLKILVEELLEEHQGATVHGHNEFSSKACPSFDVQTQL
jgi:N-acetylmuramoyl-L-alanine amidase